MAQLQTAYEKLGLRDSHPAGADLTGKRGYASMMNSDGELILATAGVASQGPFTNVGIENELVTIETTGVAFFVAGGVVRAGYRMEVTTGGKYIELASGVCVGVCKVGASADGAFGSMQVLP